MHYLIIIDCLSDWPTIVPLGRQISAKHLLDALTELFSHTAIPAVVWSDIGPQFTAKQFQAFAKQWGFQHRTSAPRAMQWQGRVCSEINEKADSCSMVWQVPR